MPKAAARMVRLLPGEGALLIWSAALLFMIRTSNIFLNNFAETTFLKRFGVEYLPFVYMANSLLTFLTMGAMAGIMRKVPSARLASYLLFVCGFSVAVLRLAVQTDLTFIYPVIFLLKAQYEALLALVFWNLANDLFNTRQSKRIFPLITAGGVIGAICASFGTPALTANIGVNNLMLAYLCTTWTGSVLVWRMGNLFPELPMTEGKRRKANRRSSFIQDIKKVAPLLKQSTLIKILVLITFLPNVLIPLMNYQFNFAINDAFATEGGMIKFFGYFRGTLNIISLVILFFVGKIYSRWGLPVALMFHPFNYVIAFMAFFFRFDIFSAMYARISVNVLRVTINNPARDILMGLFPLELRPLVRPFLRGTVVRVGTLLGAGFILLFEGRLHPKYLSLVGACFGAAWVAAAFWLKKSYSHILFQLISHKVLDLRAHEAGDLGNLFADKGAHKRLLESCRDSQGQACLMYAEMAKAQGVKDLDRYLLDVIQDRDEDTAASLLPLISAEAGEDAIVIFEELADSGGPRLTSALAAAASRLDEPRSQEFLARLLTSQHEVEVKAQAVVGLYQSDPAAYQSIIEAWLASPDPRERRAGVIAAGGSGREEYLPVLRKMLEGDESAKTQSQVLIALSRLQDPVLKKELLSRFAQDPASIPMEVLEDIPLEEEATIKAFIRLLGEPDEDLRDLALRRLRSSEEIDVKLLVASLAIPNRQVQKGLFEVMEHLNISDHDVIAFAKTSLERAYRNLAEGAALEALDPSPERDLLITHLCEKMDSRIENILRVLATQDQTGEMRVVLRGLHSSDDRLRSNALEAVETLVGHHLASAMVPLLEQISRDETLARGRNMYTLPPELDQPNSLAAYFLAKPDWVSQVLALHLAMDGASGETYQDLSSLLESPDPRVRSVARCLARRCDSEEEEALMKKTISLSDKILLLRSMELFEGLKVAELAAVASLTEDLEVEVGEAIISEGDVGETMYLVVKGGVKVVKRSSGGKKDLAKMGDGDYFGEMALFDDSQRSATVVATEPTRLIVLHKREFREAVREYPEMALQICKELSRRLRFLHQRVEGMAAYPEG